MLVCEKCSKKNIEIMVWINPNTEEVSSDAGGDAWCPDCEEHVSLREEEDISLKE